MQPLIDACQALLDTPDPALLQALVGTLQPGTRLAVAAGDKLNAGVVYYGPGPDPSEATKVNAPQNIQD